MNPTAKKHDRCTGHCCEGFFLPFSPANLAAAFYRWAHSTAAVKVAPDGPIYDDIWLIAPMVRLVRFGTPPLRMKPGHDGKGSTQAHYYRCVHHNRKTGNCEIYAMRPRMCREYPYGRECGFVGCTWKGAKEATALGFASKSGGPEPQVEAIAKPEAGLKKPAPARRGGRKPTSRGR